MFRRSRHDSCMFCRGSLRDIFVEILQEEEEEGDKARGVKNEVIRLAHSSIEENEERTFVRTSTAAN